ncbi:MAG TPA: glycosyl hydrolase family 18 protein [Acidobacteriaceae bacterium]|nr:glycosyl hydrolase family 18 protein [Acidobacteriaceae bacterium]
MGKTTIIAVTLIPLKLTFAGARPAVLDASGDVQSILASPVFKRFAFPSSGHTQYTDALLRSTIGPSATGHTLLAKPSVQPVSIEIPAGYGYVLTSRRNGGRIAVLDMQFVQQELFKQLPKQDGRLVVAVTHNTTFYPEGDDTICCGTGTHGIDRATGNSFVLGSYFANTPDIVSDRDIQPLTQQLAEFFNDPLHDPLASGRMPTGNTVSPWMMPTGGCGGRGIGSPYFLLQPTNTNHKNHFPVSAPFVAKKYHLSNVALLPWYTGTTGAVYSFPDQKALLKPAQACAMRGYGFAQTSTPPPSVAPIPNDKAGTRRLIGYWTGFDNFRLRDVSPQWDIIIVAFASPDQSAPEGTLRFAPPRGSSPDRLKDDISYVKSTGRKVMLSLGGGGKFVSLRTPASEAAFVSSVSDIVEQYGFDGVDIDFETPSMNIDAGDRDFRKPTTLSIVHLIEALRQMREHFGPGFMISLVPEGTQIPAGFVTYGGQFGSYLPLAYGLRDILSFVDVQDYNTPPLEGLDGEIYESGTAAYHAAMTELLLHGFAVGGDSSEMFPGMPADKVAVGFLTGYEQPATMHDGIDYLLTGKKPAGVTYPLANPAGYPGLLGAMYWTIDSDRRENYKYSNDVGPLLHRYPAN